MIKAALLRARDKSRSRPFAARIVPGILLAPALFCLPPARPALSTAWPGGSGTEIGWGLPSWYEPSGIVWHDGLKVILLVSDNGYVSVMNPDGSGVTNWYAGGYDLEGITVADFSSNRLYLGCEHPDSIFEFDIAAGALTGKSWNLTPWMTGPDNSGLEALAFVPDGHHPYGATRSGGLFYAGLQNNGKIYIFDVDLSVSDGVSHVATITPVPGRGDLSDMQYNAHTRTLYLVYDSSNCIREILTNNALVVEYTLPGVDQEGISFVRTSPSGGIVFMGEDSGGVKRYEGYPVIDSDGDGLANAEEYWHDGAPAYSASTDTDTSLADTDGDGYSDYVEVRGGSNPLAASSLPASIRVNFQPYLSRRPDMGFCVDSGAARGPMGFGW